MSTHLTGRNSVELGVVCERANSRMDASQATAASAAAAAATDATSDTEEAFEDADEPAWGESPPSSSGGRGLLQATLGATQTVSATATSMLATVGRRAFWTSAVRWLAPLQEKSQESMLETEDQDNSGYQLQGCHAFFADCCPQAHYSNIGCRYNGYSEVEVSNPGLQFSLDLLRAALLQYTITRQPPVAGDDAHSKVVQEVARAVLPEDTALGVSFLLMLQQPELAQQVLSALPHTDIAVQVTQYYYALQIYGSLYPWPLPSVAPMFLHDPSTVIACVAHLVHKYSELQQARDGQQQQPLEKDGVRLLTGDAAVDGRLRKYYQYFQDAEELLNDFVQGQALHRLDAGVDVDRFLTDASYKEDTVLGLCITTDDDMIELAIVLAKKYGVSLWEVHMTQLQYMFGSELTTAQIQDNIKSRKVMDTLKERPKEFLDTMKTKVLALIDGVDQDRLILFYTLIIDCNADVASVEEATEHIAVLRELKKEAPRLSYHYLLSPHPDTLDHLGTVLTSSNVDTLAALVSRVPAGEQQQQQQPPVTRSTLYCAWCIKHFLSLHRHNSAPPTVHDWIQRYTAVAQHLSELSCSDLLVMVRTLVLSPQSFKLVPLQARLAVVDAAVKSTVKMDQQAGWGAVSEELLQWKVHLASLQNPAYSALVTGPDLALRQYAKMYGSSGGSGRALESLCQRVLLDGCDLTVLRELVAVMPEDAAPQPEDTLHGLLQRALDELGADSGAHDESLALLPEHLQQSNATVQQQWWLERVQQLTAVLGQEVEEGNDLLMEDLLLQSARDLSLDHNINLATRIAVMKAIVKNMPSSTEDENILLYLETYELIERAEFPVTLCTEAGSDGPACVAEQHESKEEGEETTGAAPSSPDAAPTSPDAAPSSPDAEACPIVVLNVSAVSSSERREAVFEELLSAACTTEHTQALLDLLHLWPPFSAQVYESVTGNPWEALLTRLVGEADPTGANLPSSLIWDTVQHAVQRDQLPSSSLGHLSLELLGLGQASWLLAAKVALLKHNPRAVDAVIQNYAIAGDKVWSGDYDDEMMCSLVQRGLVPRLLDTPLYEPCCQYLVRAGDSNVLQGVIEQLQQVRPREAAALSQRVAVARPALASLTTAFRKVYSRLL